MKNDVDVRDHMLFEHRFWLQILGDHARFIHDSLAPKEEEEIERAKYFIESFDTLLEFARKNLSAEELNTLTQHASAETEQLRAFKLHLLERHLVGKIAISLSPTFLNHMVNELEEMRMQNELLGVLTPLMADHMSREECYYLMKLSEVSDVQAPDCYPTKPRVES